jgi:hypothetical protein
MLHGSWRSAMWTDLNWLDVVFDGRLCKDSNDSWT